MAQVNKEARTGFMGQQTLAILEDDDDDEEENDQFVPATNEITEKNHDEIGSPKDDGENEGKSLFVVLK